MSDASVSKLYTPALLSLATRLAEFPIDDSFGHRGEGRSRTCGSTITVGIDVASDGSVQRLGMQVSACAVGQSSAAILAAHAKGKSEEDFSRVLGQIEAWLRDGGEIEAPAPDWPGFEALLSVRQHKGRHDALLLAWKAVTQVLSTEGSAR